MVGGRLQCYSRSQDHLLIFESSRLAQQNIADCDGRAKRLYQDLKCSSQDKIHPFLPVMLDERFL